MQNERIDLLIDEDIELCKMLARGVLKLKGKVI